MRQFASSVLGCLVVSSVLSASPAHAATPVQAGDKLRAFLDGVPDAGPGYAVVVVDRNGHVLDYVRGQRNARTGAPLTMDTPIYVASQTKAYMGLLAHRLDQRGVLRLDATLATAWPEVTWPAGIDASAWTIADLLNHRVPISADAITELEAYIDAPDPAAYPRLISQFATVRDAGFQYDNLGYNLYAALLARRTGKRWQDWLAEEVFAPLALERTSARTSDFANDTLAYSHVWVGGTQAWEVVPPKPDAIMQSAGGMVTSPNDMARWLQVQLGAHLPEGFDASLIDAAHRIGAETDPKAKNAYELPCTGYAFGWNVCDFRGHRLFIHGGAYTGARTMMAFAPELGVGIGVFANSDNMTGWLTSRTVVQYLQFLTDQADADEWASRRQAQYPERVADYLQDRRKKVEQARADAAWAGWAWKPDATSLAAYAGRYRAQKSGIAVDLLPADEGLLLREGARRQRLSPAAPDLFGATWLSLDVPDPVRFQRDGTGAITGFDFGDERFVRETTKETPGAAAAAPRATTNAAALRRGN